MISYLKGTVLHKGVKYSVLMTTGGVGYKVYTTLETLGHTTEGQEVELWIHTIVREDALDLYGFENKRSLEFFELLITISGIGPKSALGILNATTVDTLIEAIVTGETGYLIKISGIGKKVAEKIILELKGKVSKDDTGGDFGTGSRNKAHDDVETVEALKALGYSLKESKDALELISKDTHGKDVATKIKAALKVLAR